MFNKDSCGLHHPGNIVPCCKSCNSSRKKVDGVYPSWEDHLLFVCSDIGKFRERRKKIIKHIERENYPNLTEDEMNALRAICKHLYSSTKAELEKSLDLYKDIDQTLVNRR